MSKSFRNRRRRGNRGSPTRRRRRPHLYQLRRGWPRPGLRARHRHPRGRRIHHPRRPTHAARIERLQPRRRRRRRSLPATGPIREHGARQRLVDVRDHVPLGRSPGRPRVKFSTKTPSPGSGIHLRGMANLRLAYCTSGICSLVDLASCHRT